MPPRGPYRLVTVNNAPERAKRLIGRVVQELKDDYDIEHIANCICMEEVGPTIKEMQPDIMFCASMWTREESDEMQSVAKSILPHLKTYAIPHGLQVNQGPDAIVEHLKGHIPILLG